MFTFAPLPSFKLLITSFFSKAKTEDEICQYWHAAGEQARLLSQSSWSLAAIALWRSSFSDNRRPIVWVPDFFCNASLCQLRETGARIVFYKIDKYLAPDFSSFKILQESEGTPDLFIVVHYFGKPLSINKVKDFCKNNHAWLVEDAAHVLIPVKGIGTSGDFVIYSPHKLLPVPDGAILVARSGGPSGFSPQVISWMMDMGAIRKDMQSLKQKLTERAGGRSYTHPLQWLIKRLIQKTGIVRGNRNFLSFQEMVNNDVPLVRDIYASKISLKLLSKLVHQLPAIAMEREHNQMLWDEWISRQSSDLSHLVPVERPYMRSWTPYQLSYLCSETDIADVYTAFLKKGIPVTTWPDIAPEVTANKEEHVIAWQMRHSRLYLAVHQSPSVGRKKYIVPFAGRGKAKSNNVSLQWNKSDKAQWDKYITASGASNLMQTWDYGETKAVKNGWNVIRGIFQDADGPFAIVQVLSKKILGIVTIYRINRGPLYFRTVDQKLHVKVLDHIAQMGNIFRLHLLFFATDERFSGNALISLYENGFKRFSKNRWESAWVDLRVPLDLLRKKLDGKWRNMLSFSEKAGLILESGANDLLFEWMIKHYAEMMDEKKIKGISTDFIRELYVRGKADETILIFRALHNDKPVAGICLAIHGNAATYLLGVNDNEGRNLKANQFLLWNAIVYLKNNNKEWFDLGGIDRQGTPGVAQFKLGIKGESYENAGEFIKW